MNNNPWIKIADVPPKFGKELEWWHNYDSCVYCGEAYVYDGKYINVGGRHWHQAIPLYDFTHWRLPGIDPTEESPTPLEEVTEKGGEECNNRSEAKHESEGFTGCAVKEDPTPSDKEEVES